MYCHFTSLPTLINNLCKQFKTIELTNNNPHRSPTNIVPLRLKCDTIGLVLQVDGVYIIIPFSDQIQEG